MKSPKGRSTLSFDSIPISTVRSKSRGIIVLGVHPGRVGTQLERSDAL
jgi:hypothetical protein